jgi:PKD repeat protein
LTTFNASVSYDPSETIVSYTWDFGDGNKTSVTQPLINHTYTRVGNYTVTLSVTDNQGLWNTTTRMIKVYYVTDLNKDGKVNIIDLHRVARDFGKSL